MVTQTGGEQREIDALPIESIDTVSPADLDALVPSSAAFETDLEAEATRRGFRVLPLYVPLAPPAGRSRRTPESLVMGGLTVLIAARDAASTIQRAVRSATNPAITEIVLVDDFSSDDTVALARAAAGRPLRVVRPMEHRSLGFTRQTGLDALETPRGVWLDADDEMLPDRAWRLMRQLDTGTDFVADGVEIVDTDGATRTLPLPAFLRDSRAAVRLFERNYLPGIGVTAFRTDAARAIGYDATLHGAEDVDLVLRAVAGGARFAFVAAPGYRIHASPVSLSRDRDNQRAMYARVLRKHSYADVRRLYEAAGYDARVTVWGLVSMAIFRQEFDVAWQVLEEVGTLVTDPAVVLEPDGPCTAPEGWRLAFHRGTLALLQDQIAVAAEALAEAERLHPTAEGANNLGVVLGRLDRLDDARGWFQTSLARFSAGRDAADNLAAACPDRIITHPLRRFGARLDYPAVPASASPAA